MVKVSVIVPVYNVEKYLKKCLESIVNQTLSDIEVICVNDGSTDNSLAILKSYEKNDDRFKIISQENGGLGYSRNVGLKYCEGEYIFFLDSDDYIREDALEKLYENAKSNDSDLVFLKIARFTNDNEFNYNIPGFDFDEIFEDVDFNNFTFNYHDVKHYVMNASFAAWCKLYKRDFLNNFDDFTFPVNIEFEDVLFHVKSVIRSKLSFVPEFLYFYRNNPLSIINTSDGMDIFEVVSSVESFLIENNIYGNFKNEFDLFKLTQILNYILTSNSEEYFQKAKTEFTNLKLGSDNQLISDYIMKRYKLVLNSDSLISYIIGHYDIIYEELANEKTRLNNYIQSLNDTIGSLNNNICELNREIDGLNYENEIMLNKVNNLITENDCLVKQNKRFNKSKVNLAKKNKDQKSEIKKLKKLNKSLINSKSWKITKPMRAFFKLFK